MAIAHQGLKELAQRSDEEVVQLWLEQRGMTMHPETKPAHIPLPNQKVPEELKTQKSGIPPFVLRPIMHPIPTNKDLEHLARAEALQKYAVIIDQFPSLHQKINDLQTAVHEQAQNNAAHKFELKQELANINLRLARMEHILFQFIPDHSKDA